MRQPAMVPKDFEPKRPRLTLAQLASYDDVCTDALIDQVYFWSKIRKNRAKYNSGRGFTEEGVAKILFEHVICEKDTATAEHKLLRVNGFKKFVEKLQTQRERDDFKKHLRKYINLWLPECPFEVATTNRYTIVTQEAAVFARREIEKGETIRYLCGNLVAITEEEEKDLDLTRRDFSIVMSSRKKSPSLFLGPARFANHDCNANARLTTTGPDGMQIVAVRHIHRDEEITVTYGEDYFGSDNCECLCRSCEVKAQGGWTVSPDAAAETQTPIPSKEDSVEPYGFRRKRKYATFSASETATPDPDSFQPAKRRRSSTADLSRSSSLSPKQGGRASAKVKRRSALSRFSPEISNQSAVVDDRTPVPGSSPAPVIAPPEHELKIEMGSLQPKSPQTGPNADDTGAIAIEQDLRPVDQSIDERPDQEALQDFGPKTPTKSIRSSQLSADSTDVDSVFEGDEVDLIPTGTPSSVHSDCPPPSSSPIKSEEPSIIEQTATVEVPISETTNVVVKEEPTETPMPALDPPEESDSELSSLPSDEEFDDIHLCIVRKRKSRAPKRKKLAPPRPIQMQPEIPKIRYPNDYTNTPLLLAEPESKWVQCMTCSRVWVQQNAYYTRRECPRCERHSKLYGYRWPKTEKFKGDDERVKDHREVHRFLDAEEEEELRKTQKDLPGLEGQGPEIEVGGRD